MAIFLTDTGFTPEDFNFDSCDSGGMPEPGVYHAKLVKVESSDDESRPSENLTFQVLVGTTSGQGGKQITEYLNLSGKSDDKTRKVIQRAMGWGKRLGVYNEADAKALAPINYEKALQKEFIIEVENHEYTDNNTGAAKTSRRITYMGVWGTDHADAPACPRWGKGGVVTGGGTGATGKVEPAKGAATGKTTTAGKVPAAKRNDI